MDDRTEKIGYKIREAQMQKVPYMMIIGDKEMEEKTFAVRHFTSDESGQNKQFTWTKEELIDNLTEEVRSRTFNI